MAEKYNEKISSIFKNQRKRLAINLENFKGQICGTKPEVLESHLLALKHSNSDFQCKVLNSQSTILEEQIQLAKLESLSMFNKS